MIWYILGGIALFIIGAVVGCWVGTRSIGKGFEQTERDREEFRHL